MDESLVARTILAQIESIEKGALDRWGADMFIAWPEGVLFGAMTYTAEKVNVEIELTPMDEYKLRFMKFGDGDKAFAVHDGIYFDMLVDVIDLQLGYK